MENEITPTEAILRSINEAQNIAKLLSNSQNETYIAMPVPLPERMVRKLMRRFYTWIGWRYPTELSQEDVSKLVSVLLNLGNQTQVIVKALQKAGIDIGNIMNTGEIKWPQPTT